MTMEPILRPSGPLALTGSQPLGISPAEFSLWRLLGGVLRVAINTPSGVVNEAY